MLGPGGRPARRGPTLSCPPGATVGPQLVMEWPHISRCGLCYQQRIVLEGLKRLLYGFWCLAHHKYLKTNSLAGAKPQHWGDTLFPGARSSRVERCARPVRRSLLRAPGLRISHRVASATHIYCLQVLLTQDESPTRQRAASLLRVTEKERPYAQNVL